GALKIIAYAGLSLSFGCVVGAQQAAPASYPPPAYPTGGEPYTTSWPLRLDGAEGLIQVYQPQPESFQDDTLTARAAVSLTPPGATDPVFGAMWMNARVASDRDARTVTILGAQVRRVKFPDMDESQQQRFAQILETEIPRLNVTFSLDQLLTSLDVTQQEKAAAAQLETTPPKIIVTQVPATLIVIDGPPQLQPIDVPGVMRVINTPFVVLLDNASKQYFVKAGDVWFTSRDVSGGWSRVGAPPPQIADAANRLAQPPDPNAPPPEPGPQPQQLIVAMEPTELISSEGPPTYTPLPGNDLLYMSNTQSDVFMDVASQQVFVLLAGRWYTARTLQGPWQYVASDRLPPAFAQIPPDSPKAHVLACVAGTVEAQDAKLDARIPQTATIARNSGDTLSVSYDGPPQFESIQQSPVSYATNCSDPVFVVNRRYYCCQQAVWYESAAPVGPWSVCISVPQPIYLIPPSCPYYYCRFVYVYGYTPSVVYCGYLPGYTGCYVYGPTIVYGTGYYHRGWYHQVYYPRPHTWGIGARYSLRYGTWADGAPYRWDHRWFARDTGRRDWFGPRGYLGYNRLNNARPVIVGNQTNIRTVTNVRNINIYNRQENVRRNAAPSRDVQVRREPRGSQQGTARGGPPQAGGRNAPTRNERPQAGRDFGTPENNVYAGRDGQIYRRTQSGWEQRNKQGWQRYNGVPEARQAAEAPRGNATDRRARPTPPNVDRRGQSPTPQTPQRNQRQPVERQPTRTEPPPQRGSGSGARGTPRQYSPPPGLEADHAARERGIARSRSESGGGSSGRGSSADRGPSGGAGRSGGSSGAPPSGRGGGGGSSGGPQQQNRR
ncbi:MAG TPA: hypothetical protein VN541_00355, partial [Tepidisphaeraceae bacterium]|nr:hypothetical protein [Tepidisphaeraceae bacterium]